MAKAAIFVPYPDMCEVVRPLLHNYAHIAPMCVEFTRSNQIVARARQLEAEGCELMVARGLQAMLIKNTVKIPLVEIQITTQELGVLIMALRQELTVENPVIALIGFSNMFGDTSRIDELFHIRLRLYMVKQNEELARAAELAVQEGADALIGGEIACETAMQLETHYRFLSTGSEGIQYALEAASRAGYAIELGKRNSAEINAMLDNTNSGIMQIDRSGVVRRANSVAFTLLRLEAHNLLGRDVCAVIPKIDRRVVEAALHFGRESYTSVLDDYRKTIIVNVAPIAIDGVSEGALLTFQDDARIIEIDSELRRELYQRGFIAKYNFANLIANAPETVDAIALAKRISRYSAPILISGEAGSGKAIMAQCIHNESLLRKNAFVMLDCSAWLPDTLDTMLFGNYTSKKDAASMAELAENGTLCLAHVGVLPFETQYKLLSLIRGKFMRNGSNSPSTANVRIIASCTGNLIAQVERGEFRSDLYYALNVLNVELLPLRNRRADILGWVDRDLDEWQKKYKRFVHLTQGARKFMENYDWPGNLDQINSICERIVLLTEKRNVDEVFLRRQLEQIAPKMQPGTDRVVLFKDPKAARLAELLRKHSGNREAVAKELGVSKTTLWRYVKKYGIEQDFSY